MRVRLLLQLFDSSCKPYLLLVIGISLCGILFVFFENHRIEDGFLRMKTST